ncbi:shikimate dehydrogenase family protein [Odoribacter lunatus]|uniref:shikimate dehydrogenase family protein n=1 Tax=Odoribacter lunatus TaxID=2941335 RepID=UPI00203A5419|nr:shikimate dehydrogenase [Odoribacter lunatus]
MDTYGIVGFPLKHSFSQRYFSEKFQCEKIEAEYLKFEQEDISEILPLLSRYKNLKGFNVTIPHKQSIIPFLDVLSEEAQKIGAVNCVKIISQNSQLQFIGYNTDVYGFKYALIRFIPENITHALILGNGGAAKAVKFVLQALGIQSLIVSRTPRKADEIGYHEIAPLLSQYRLIINTTPLGTWPDIHSYPDIPYSLLNSGHYLFDLVYNPETTEFMKRGAFYGAHTCNGWEMLIKQAEKSWAIWSCNTIEK